MQITPNKSAPRIVACLVALLICLGFFQAVMASDLGLTEPDCRSCHGPTMADRHHIMVPSKGFECFKCHSFVQDPDTLMQEVTVTRDCLACHTGSLADRHHALVDRKILDCLTCHKVSWNEQQMAYSIDFRFSPAGSGVISGVITDQSLTPLAGARLSTNTGAYVTATAADGTYTLDPVTAATYKLTAAKPGYIDQTVRLRVIAGETTSADLQLAAAPAPLVVTEQCGDGVDNDGDGLTDCADAACTSDSSCQLPPVEICDNGLDDDLDGVADCSDSDCAAHAACAAGDPPPASVAKTVFKPAESAQPPAVAPSPGGAGADQDDSPDEAVTVCSDPAACDSGESSPDPGAEEAAQMPSPDATQKTEAASTQSESPQPVSRAWAPRIRLSSVKRSLPVEHGRAGNPRPSPAPARLAPVPNAAKRMDKLGAVEQDTNRPTRPGRGEQCGDGIDNDGNGLADCADSQCVAHGSCRVSAMEVCDNGSDDDRNGFADCSDNYCMDGPVCALVNSYVNPESGAPAAVPGLAPPGAIIVTAYPPPVARSLHLAQAVQLQFSAALLVAPGGDTDPAGQTTAVGPAPLAGLKPESRKAARGHGEAQSDHKRLEINANPIGRLKLSARLLKQRLFDAIAWSTYAAFSGDDPVHDAGMMR